MPTRVVRIATSADSPPRLQGEVVALDRFSAEVALETREAALREGANVWLHFDAPDSASSLSVAGIVSAVAPGGRITVLLSLSPREYSRLHGLLIASTAMARVVRPEFRLYSVSPTPTTQYRSFRFPMTGEYTPGARGSDSQSWPRRSARP